VSGDRDCIARDIPFSQRQVEPPFGGAAETGNADSFPLQVGMPRNFF
jgi:hypothetical protein